MKSKILKPGLSSLVLAFRAKNIKNNKRKGMRNSGSKGVSNRLYCWLESLVPWERTCYKGHPYFFCQLPSLLVWMWASKWSIKHSKLGSIYVTLSTINSCTPKSFSSTRVVIIKLINNVTHASIQLFGNKHLSRLDKEEGSQPNFTDTR